MAKRRQTIVYTIGENQSIYDLALQLTGSLSGMADIIDNYNKLSDDLKGTELAITKKSDPRLDLFLRRKYVFATANIDNLWILGTGVWNDSGIWIDTETWNDN